MSRRTIIGVDNRRHTLGAVSGDAEDGHRQSSGSSHTLWPCTVHRTTRACAHVIEMAESSFHLTLLRVLPATYRESSCSLPRGNDPVIGHKRASSCSSQSSSPLAWPCCALKTTCSNSINLVDSLVAQPIQPQGLSRGGHGTDGADGLICTIAHLRLCGIAPCADDADGPICKN